MSTIDIRVPDIGDSTDVDVIELCVAVGDSIDVDDPMIVIESDKATMEIPATETGTIVALKLAIGDKVSEGDLILTMEVNDDASVAPKPSDNQESARVDATASEISTETIDQSDTVLEQVTERVEVVSVPDIGSDSSVVVELSVAIGDEVEVDDSLVVLESDKATMEVPSPVKGRVQRFLLKVGDTVSEGSSIAEVLISEASAVESPESSESPSASEHPAATVAPSPVAQNSKTASVAAAATKLTPPASGAMYETSAQQVHAGPAVRKLAREFGVDLAQVPGSGPKKRILKEDVQAFVKSRLQQSPIAATGSGIPSVKLPDFSSFGDIERRPMTKIHKVTAENMHKAWLNVPHVTQFDEADITELEAFRKGQKAAAEAKGTRLTPMPFILKACAYALRAMPQFNVSLDMTTHEIVQKHYIHIGIAVDTPDGLVVPVIRDVDTKTLWEIADETLSLAQKAKDKKLTPAEMQGGCFTISSLGSVGGTAFTPIVNTPEVAILGVSKAAIKPVYDNGDFQPRLMLPLSLSYDHRAVNGADAARFTALLAELLADIRKMLL